MPMPPGFPVTPPNPQRHSHAEVKPHIPSTARVYDYMLGGKDNYAADRAVAEQLEAAIPNVREQLRGNRQFLHRAVRFIAGQGITQFMDLGTGIPTAGPTHEIAQEVQPGTRVAYVDNDPVVLAHARALLTGDGVRYVDHDLRDPAGLLAEEDLGKLIDFTRPVGVLAIAVAHFLPNAQELMDAVMAKAAPGSWLALTAATDDPQVQEAGKAYEKATSQAVPRSVEEIRKLFRSVELVEPGVVPLHEWRPDDDTYARVPLLYGGVGVKP